MTAVWQLLSDLSAPMAYQMELDGSLFRDALARREAGIPVTPLLRFFYAAVPGVTVGYSHPQPALHERESIIRRLTGGGRVEHGDDLIFSLIAPREADDSFKSVRLAYLKIHEAVKMALESLGHAPEFYRCDQALPRGGECFRFPIATDLSIRGQKVAGGAQKRSMGMMLHQESIRLIHGLEADALRGSLLEAFEKRFGIRFECALWDPALLESARSSEGLPIREAAAAL